MLQINLHSLFLFFDDVLNLEVILSILESIVTGFLEYLVTIQDSTSHLLRSTYENVYYVGKSPIAKRF